MYSVEGVNYGEYTAEYEKEGDGGYQYCNDAFTLPRFLFLTYSIIGTEYLRVPLLICYEVISISPSQHGYSPSSFRQDLIKTPC